VTSTHLGLCPPLKGSTTVVQRCSLAIERSRARVSPTAPSSMALGNPLTHTCLCHQTVLFSTY